MNQPPYARRMYIKRKCSLCNQPLPQIEGCCCQSVQCNGVSLPRICFGDEEYNWGTRRCADCGVHKGSFHHENCSCEICPMCGELILLCNCETEFVI